MPGPSAVPERWRVHYRAAAPARTTAGGGDPRAARSSAGRPALASELASARVRTMSPSQILARMTAFRLLASPAAGRNGRHVKACGWSWDPSLPSARPLTRSRVRGGSRSPRGSVLDFGAQAPTMNPRRVPCAQHRAAHDLRCALHAAAPVRTTCSNGSTRRDAPPPEPALTYVAGLDETRSRTAAAGSSRTRWPRAERAGRRRPRRRCAPYARMGRSAHGPFSRRRRARCDLARAAPRQRAAPVGGGCLPRVLAAGGWPSGAPATRAAIIEPCRSRRSATRRLPARRFAATQAWPTADRASPRHGSGEGARSMPRRAPSADARVCGPPMRLMGIARALYEHALGGGGGYRGGRPTLQGGVLGNLGLPTRNAARRGHHLTARLH